MPFRGTGGEKRINSTLKGIVSSLGFHRVDNWGIGLNYLINWADGLQLVVAMIMG